VHIYTVLNTHYYVMKGSFINEAKQRFGIIDVYFGKYSFYEKSDNSRLKTFFLV